MKAATVLQFNSLIDLGKFIKLVQSISYRIDTSKLTVKAQLTSFEIGIALEQYNAVVSQPTEKV